jgi:hypothetical protein
MLASDIRHIIAEEEEVQFHLEAVEAIVHRYSKRVSESLEKRIKRAHAIGEWLQLSSEECAVRHEHEKLHLTSQYDTLQYELNRTRRKLSSLKHAKGRARRILADAAAFRKKQRC